MCFSRAPVFPQEVADQLMHTMAAKGGSGEQKRLTSGGEGSLWPQSAENPVEESSKGKPQHV